MKPVISTAQIQRLSVETAKIQNVTITSAQIETLGVASTKIASIDPLNLRRPTQRRPKEQA